MPTPTTLIYHADCPDGFGAALAARQYCGPQTTCVPLHHGETWENIPLAGHAVYILDFSLSPDDLLKMAAHAASVTQIDHHASARKDWATLLSSGTDGYENFRHPDLPLTVIFDLDKSGARLAWEHFFPTRPLPLLLAHIEDIDLWRFRLPGTRAFNRALRLLPYDFSVWEQLLDDTQSPDSPRYRSMLAEGGAIEQFFDGEISRLAASRLVMPAVLRGDAIDPLQARRHQLPVIQAEQQTWQAISGLAINADSLFASELGHLLTERSGTFGLVWQLAPGNEVRASLRSAGQINVADIAAHYGGGGHPNAAGFRLPLADFISEVLTPFPT